MAESLVQGINGTLALNAHQFRDAVLDGLFSFEEFRPVGRKTRSTDFISQVILDGVRQHKVTIGQTLHEGRSAQSVGSVIREVGFTDTEETGDGGLEFIVHPNTTHRVVDGRVNHHRCFIGIVINNLFVHLEEVTVAGLHHVATQSVDGIGKVQVDGQTRCAYTETGIATFLGSSGGHVPGHQVAESGVTAFQVVVPVVLRKLSRFELTSSDGFSVFFFLGYPDTTVVTQRLRHQCQFRLVFAVYGDTGGMNLSISRVGEVGTFLVNLDGGGSVGTHGVGRQEEGIAVASGTDNNGMSGEAFNFTGNQVTSDDAARLAIDDDQVEHFIAGIQFDRPFVHLTAQGGVGTQKQLLSCLALGVERTGNLSPTKGAVVQQAAVFAGERYTLSDALVDNAVGDFSQAVDISLPGSVVSTLDGIVKQAVNRVTIILVILGRVDATLSGNGVSPAGGILDTEVQHIKAQLAQRGGGRSTCQPSADHDDVKSAFIGRIDQLLMCFEM